MLKHLARPLSPALLLAAMAACTHSSTPGSGSSLVRSGASETALSSLPATDLPAAVAANNSFAFALYPLLTGPQSGVSTGNFMTSPLSAQLALTMAYAGATGQTATEMANALQFGDAGASIFDDQSALTQTLATRAAAALASDTQSAAGNGEPAPSASDYALEVVNSVWGQEGLPWASPFLDILAKSYGTGVYTANFESDAAGALTAINDWVSTETSGRIDPLLTPGSIDSTTRLVIVNAVHLKMPWASAPFSVGGTAPGPFTRSDGSQVTANLMHGSVYDPGTFGYAQTSEGTFVAMPLAGGELQAVFMLPSHDLPTLVTALTPSTWASVWATVGVSISAELNITLPKFTFTTQSFSLVTPLQTLGMNAAFNAGTADFSGLCPKSSCGELYISNVLQKAMIGVSEEGVEAAAATAVLARASTVLQPVTATFDHPFLMAIVDKSGAVLFLGQVNDPTDTGSP